MSTDTGQPETEEKTPSPHDYAGWAFRLARDYGFHTLLLIVACWFMYSQVENYREQRETDLRELKERIKEDREYIRTEFRETIDRNTEAFKDLTAKIQTMPNK